LTIRTVSPNCSNKRYTPYLDRVKEKTVLLAPFSCVELPPVRNILLFSKLEKNVIGIPFLVISKGCLRFACVFLILADEKTKAGVSIRVAPHGGEFGMTLVGQDCCNPSTTLFGGSHRPGAVHHDGMLNRVVQTSSE